MSNRTRQWRRAQNARILNRRMDVERHYGWAGAHGPDGSTWWDLKGREGTLDTWDDVFAYRYRFARSQVDTHTPCSCYMCGNPRRYFNAPTLQEVRHYENEINQFDELCLDRLNFRYRRSGNY